MRKHWAIFKAIDKYFDNDLNIMKEGEIFIE